MYRVRWKDAQPYIEHGEIVIVGKKRQQRRIQWPSEEKLLEFSSGQETIKEAIEQEILEIAFDNGKGYWPVQKKGQPWTLSNAIIKIRRLTRKLQKFHLVWK